MNRSYLVILLFISCFLHEAQQYYNEYAVEMDMDALEANLDLSTYNIEVIRKVSALGNVYHLKHVHNCYNNRCKRDASSAILDILNKHPSIHRVEEQVDLEVELKTNYNDIQYYYDDRYLDVDMQNKILEEYENEVSGDLDDDTDMEKKLSTVDHVHQSDLMKKKGLKSNANVDKVQVEIAKKLRDDNIFQDLVKERQKKLEGFAFNDPEMLNMWQYHNFGQFSHVNPGFDLNLFYVYKANITGLGIVVSVIDDGIDTKHKEIKNNFDIAASLDLNDPKNLNGNPRGPSNLKFVPSKDGHGTLCASTIAGEANNHFCAFGVAFKANLGGIRMLAQNMVTDLLEAFALTHNNQYISIYSNSWGPKDTGKKTSPATYYVKKALQTGTSLGRGGKGSIYLFAAGNGGRNYDHCGGDGMVNSPYTIAVTATNIYGQKPAYTEECSAINIASPVGGYSNDATGNDIDPRLIASAINKGCSKQFVGTSAATPLVSGCIALVLEANPTLSWRDIQYLFTISARIPNRYESVWQLNTAGFLISHIYGFGVLDCSAMVRNGQMWNNVGPIRICIGGISNSTAQPKIKIQKRTRITFETLACKGTENAIDRLEHVVVHTKIKHVCRGDLAITLTSPTKTLSFLLKNRKLDDNDEAISFSFMTLMNWGENPIGQWHFDVADSGLCGTRTKDRGTIFEVALEFHGTKYEDSGVYRNRDLIDTYFQKIGIKIPKFSIILDGDQTYDYFNRQRKYFIQLTPLHEQSVEYKSRLMKIKSTNDLKSLQEKLKKLNNKIPEEEIKYLTRLSKNKKA